MRRKDGSYDQEAGDGTPIAPRAQSYDIAVRLYRGESLVDGQGGRAPEALA